MHQPAFVLHSRPYKESSALVDLFTPQGRLRAVMRAARGKAGSLIRPFVTLEVELRGKSELKTVARLESAGPSHWLDGQALFSGMYLNELLIRLLPMEDAHPALFEHYVATLPALAAHRPLEPLLRSFEWRLLDELGYGFALDVDIAGEPIDPRRPRSGRRVSAGAVQWRGTPRYGRGRLAGSRRARGGQAADAPSPRTPFGRSTAGQPRTVHESEGGPA
jgi:DNA repair protein RecO (recombination protein O)